MLKYNIIINIIYYDGLCVNVVLYVDDPGVSVNIVVNQRDRNTIRQTETEELLIAPLTECSTFFFFFFSTLIPHEALITTKTFLFTVEKQPDWTLGEGWRLVVLRALVSFNEL